MAESFLGALAKAYMQRNYNLSDYCFLFPNKRSGTFFLRHLSEVRHRGVMIAPVVMGINEFTATIADRLPASRLDLIFRLYSIYRSILRKGMSMMQDDDLIDFEKFVPWGEIVLSDFSEVEQYNVDAAEIFRNVRDYREISSNFLTEEQREVIERFFGYTPQAEDVAGFWKSVHGDEEQSRLAEKFVELWRVLPELFEALTKSLEDEGLALEGSASRIAYERVAELGRDVLPWKRVVVAGFNSLSTTEALLFKELSLLKDDDGEAYCDFFWDVPGPVLQGDGGGAAARTMKRLLKNFPEPVWAADAMRDAQVDAMPAEITVFGSPSNVAQVKIASATAGEWQKKFGEKAVKEARMAIVVPDENLLLPLLYSLPAELKSVNLTMGYSMRYTSVASFVYHLRRLQLRRRIWGDDVAFYHADMKPFLAHPLVHVAIGSDEANKIRGFMAERHRLYISRKEIADFSEVCAEILAPVSFDAGAEESIEYMRNILNIIDIALADGTDVDAINTVLERSQIEVYRFALTRLLESVEQHNVRIEFRGVLMMVDKLLAGEKITFEGEPLEGLQIMGLLETRALDFDRLIIMSMNDKVMPRRARKRTFIPESLRSGYGLPLSAHTDELYAYYFYRMIARAKEVDLIYDSRASDGMRSGGKSRFIFQLEMLHARGKVKEREFSFNLSSHVDNAVALKKSPLVRKELDAFKPGGNKYLSASAFMKYCSCPVAFYYVMVKGISDDVEVQDAIDSITQGTIVHNVMQSLYLPREKQRKYLKGIDRVLVTAATIDKILEGDRVEREVQRAVNQAHFKLEGEQARNTPLPAGIKYVAEHLAQQVREALQLDRHTAPFTIVGLELSGSDVWRLEGAPEVNMKYAFDRVDIVRGRWRVVDYKTGASHIAAEADFEEFFTGNYKTRYGIQLMTYAALLRERAKKEGEAIDDVEMLIYDLSLPAEEMATHISIAKEEFPLFSGIEDTYKSRLSQMLNEIFDADHDLAPAVDADSCEYCHLKTLCGRK